MHCRLVLFVLTLGLVRPLLAQDSTAAKDSMAAQDTALVPRLAPLATLTLSDALAQARRHSPVYRQALNNAGPARWGVRNAYGNFLPSVQVASDLGYTGSGQSTFGAFFNQTSPFLRSTYSIGLQMQLDGKTLAGPGQQKALERATSQDIENAGVGLRFDVTDQYLTAEDAVAQTEVAREQVRRNEEFLRLAQTRYRVGQATLLDVRQAEATRGTSQVTLLRAFQTENEAKLELFRRMGVVPPAPVEQIALTDSFTVAEPRFKLDELITMAEGENPSLRALRERSSAAGASVRAAKSEYFPTLTAQAGWSGFAQQFTNENQLLSEQLQTAQGQAADCQFNNQVRTGLNLGGTTPDCFGTFGLDATGKSLNPATAALVRSRNDVFPFGFAGQPFQATVTLSLPIFSGFGRELRVSQARADEEDADEAARAQGLAVRASVHARFLGLTTAYKTIGVQEVGRAAARDQLRLAQDRYRVGLGTALEVTDAQSAVERSEADYVTAVYDYHRAFAALEAAVGRPLR
ncbi:MAG TPA: TolC family protein [Gemmatimonadales bacterium]|nr:TolC family protein [Gemmatimonadales bacterium]